MADSHGGSMLPGLATVQKFVVDMQVKRSLPITAKMLIITQAVVLFVFFIISPSQTLNNFSLLIFFSPLWVVPILYKALKDRRLQSRRAEYLNEREYVLLEILMPRDTAKTPKAMETFFSSLHIGTGESTWWKILVEGRMRPWWSFEIVSLGGRIHFYIWTQAYYRRLVESYLYSQYPNVEIIEAEDYSRLTDPSDDQHDLWGCEYVLSQDDAFPILTYVDYDMNPGDKPEETVDPLAQLLELMGSIGPKEQLWLQFIIRQNKDEKFEGMRNKVGKQYSFKDQAAEVVSALRDSTVRETTRIDPATGQEIKSQGFPNPTKGISETIASVERKVAKQNFDVGIRCIYSAEKDAFNPVMIPAQLTLFKPFNNETSNRLSVTSVFGGAFNDFPWEDPGGHHRVHLKHVVKDMYRRRIYYASPYVGPWNIMSTEELATLFHVPSSAITTPNLPRIQSTTAGAPSNLPT